jgi:hypothetical protein
MKAEGGKFDSKDISLRGIEKSLEGLDYDAMAEQMLNVSMVVTIIAAVLWTLKNILQVGKPNGIVEILQVPMSNILRTSMIAGVVAPIVIFQLRTLIQGGIKNASARILRGVFVSVLLLIFLLSRPAENILGEPLVTGFPLEFPALDMNRYLSTLPPLEPIPVNTTASSMSGMTARAVGDPTLSAALRGM